MQPPETLNSEAQSPETTLIPGSDAVSRAIFDAAFDMYAVLDRSGTIVWLGGRILRETTARAEMLTGQLFSETVFWQSSENTARLVEKAVTDAARGHESTLHLDFRVRADKRTPIELRLQPLGKSLDERIFAHARCLPTKTAAELREIERERLLRAAENADIGLWFWDIGAAQIFSTPRCNDLLGLPTSEPATFESFLHFVHQDDRRGVEDLFARLQNEGSRYSREFRVLRSDGSIDWIVAEGESTTEGHGAPTGMMGMVRKITDQKYAVTELAKVYDRERRARDEAVEANRAKDFFLAFVSHELRSPLNAILGWSKILLTKKVDDATRQNALETIERSARLQTKLINDLVDSARVASGKLRLEFHPTNLCEIVRVAYQAQKPTAEAHDLDFTVTTDCDEVIVFGDAGRLQQVLINLISNAIKFTPDGGKIAIDIKTTSETVTVSVKDSGQGINPEALPNIFQQFSQGEVGRSRANTGLGLGLSIVKILVAKHGGVVHALSEGLGKGSEFVITLPLSESPPQSGALEQRVLDEGRRPLVGKRILIVEDDPDSREVLQLFLEQSGASVVSAETASKATEILSRQSPDLPDVIISDLAMPEEDGYAMIARIRQLPASEGGAIPAIALSAFTTLESKQKAFDSGFELYLTKPFEPEKLVADILQLTAQPE